MGQIAKVVHVLALAALVPAYVMLLMFGVELTGAGAPDEDGAGLGLVALATVDVAAVYGVAWTSRLRRARLYAFLVVAFLAAKALPTGLVLPWLPLAVVLPGLVLTLMGRRPDPAPAKPWWTGLAQPAWAALSSRSTRPRPGASAG